MSILCSVKNNKMAKKTIKTAKVSRKTVKSAFKKTAKAIKSSSSSIQKTKKPFDKDAMTNKKVNDVVGEVVGEDAIKIVEYLKDKENISEFKIAEKTNSEIHQIRNILYRLHNQHLVTYKRKKDRQKGWYISYWTFNKRRVKDLVGHLRIQKLDKFRERLEKEEKNRGFFFLCKNTCVRMDFDQATEYQFKCPECGTLLDQHDNSKTIDSLKQRIIELEILPHNHEHQ